VIESSGQPAAAGAIDPAASLAEDPGLGIRLEAERGRASLLGDVREAIFGAQDGLVSTLAVVSAVSGATPDRFPILIAGIAAGLAGIFSMAAGEYLSSKSQREISLAQIAAEARGSRSGSTRG
jgi:VIT1/CCC1 family predicted Fe2+/Mn2+ transporter